MQENINFEELDKSLQNLKDLTEKMSKNLVNVNNIIKDTMNSGAGVWDSRTAELYRIRWEALMEEFPEIIQVFNKQSLNLEQFINNMKKVDNG